MLTAHVPEDWRALQAEVAQILRECGFQAEVEAPITLARGQAEVDVYAVETVRGRRNVIFCECKLWKATVPQAVIHSFRSVVADGGANVGYVITSSGFQSGAYTAADLTNIRLVTWAEFQNEFEKTWIDHHFRPQITERLDPLMSLIEPLPPRGFDALGDQERQRFLDVRAKYFDLGALAMGYSTYTAMFASDIGELPLRPRFAATGLTQRLPDEILDATGYRDLLAIMIRRGEQAIAELRSALEPTGSDAPGANS